MRPVLTGSGLISRMDVGALASAYAHEVAARCVSPHALPLNVIHGFAPGFHRDGKVSSRVRVEMALANAHDHEVAARCVSPHALPLNVIHGFAPGFGWGWRKVGMP